VCHSATQCNTVQHSATHRNTPQHTATWYRVHISSLAHTYSLLLICSVLQCVAVYCSVSQCVAVCCSVLLCVTTCCSVLQYAAECTSRYKSKSEFCLIWICTDKCDLVNFGGVPFWVESVILFVSILAPISGSAVRASNLVLLFLDILSPSTLYLFVLISTQFVQHSALLSFPVCSFFVLYIPELVKHLGNHAANLVRLWLFLSTLSLYCLSLSSRSKTNAALSFSFYSLCVLFITEFAQHLGDLHLIEPLGEIEGS